MEIAVAARRMPAGPAVLLYFAVYFAWLWWSVEGEALHWLTLVAVPAVGLAWLETRGRPVAATVLAGIGLRRATWRSGLAWAVPLGLGLTALQLLVSRNRGAALDVLASWHALYLVPGALLLLLATAAFTEEVFFRGILLERLARWWSAPLLALAASSLLFGLYHLPYAYLNPHWPSYGDLPRAFSAAMGQGVIGGLVLGGVYLRSGRNLLAPVAVHGLINLVPAVALLARLAGLR
jgi:membrane protease YdiL (CAAX protease family)